MSIPSQLPLPILPPKDKVSGDTLWSYLNDLTIRLANWVVEVSNLSAQTLLQQVPLTPNPNGIQTLFDPDGHRVSTDQNGMPQALIFQMPEGIIIPSSATFPPPAGTWTVDQTPTLAGQDPTEGKIRFGTPPPGGKTLFAGFLVSRANP